MSANLAQRQAPASQSPNTEWAYSLGKPTATACIRQQAEHFKVTEVLNHQPSGEGEHIYLHIEKKNQNTDWLAGKLASFCGLKRKAMSYAGLKDRHAVTRQWFSVHLPVKTEPDWSSFNIEGVTILQVIRHQRKLQRGALTANQFEILLTSVVGDADELEQRLHTIKEHGVPNYFGEQRFGIEQRNIVAAISMFANNKKVKRSQRSIYLSAARSWLFNELLSLRINNQTWNRVQPGDLLMLAGKNSVFLTEQNDIAELQNRYDQHDIHISGPLWGVGEPVTTLQVQDWEQQVAHNHPELSEGLIKENVAMARRPLRLLPKDLQWRLEGNTLQLNFTLPAGAYATAVLRELVTYQNALGE